VSKSDRRPVGTLHLRPWDHAINLKPDTPDTINCKVYPLAPARKLALRKWIDDEEAKGYIRKSQSPITSSWFEIAKKTGDPRPVQDYRIVNKYTIKDNAPLPNMKGDIAALANAHIFTTFDIRWGYNNVRIKDGDQWKAAFKTCFSVYEPMVMYFGLTNSPATFQTMMNHIFRPLIDRHALLGTTIRVYMDDIIIGTSSTVANHTAAVHDVLDLLAEHDLFVKLSKCRFHVSRVNYLGVILEEGVTCMDPIKIAGIKDWPIPKKVKDVHSFLGFCNFYRSFIRGFAHLARPLNLLTRKDAIWQWGDKEQTVFDTLKTRVTSELILVQPDLTEQFTLEVDASGYVVGAVLLQRKTDGKLHPIEYFSATLNDTERNYDIYDLELLAIVKALDHWRPYLAGSPHKIKVFSDHMNLQYWRQPQKISRRVAREVLALSEYDIEIHHIKGKSNRRADALSRRPDYNNGENDNRDVTVLPNHIFVRAADISAASTDQPSSPHIPTLSPEMMVIDHPIYEQDEDVLKTWIDPHRLKRIHGTWYKDGRRVVTGGLHDKRTIIRAHHDPPVYGHPGITRSIQLMSRHYWWPKIRQDVHDYVKGCADCQRNKINTHPIRAPLQPIYPKPEALPFETIALDFITKLPESEGSDSILTVVDHDCTKAAIFIPCREEITAEETAGLYVRHVFTRYGLPSRIISDRDPRFASKFTRELCRILGISQNISTAYHPRTDGQSEAKNKWVEQHLRFYVNHYQKNWTYYLPMAEFAHNTWASETTRESPFTLLMGYNPRADWIDRPSPIPQVALRIQQFKEARERAQQSMIKAQKSWVKHKDTPKFQSGDLVWLEGKNLRTVQPTAKLVPKRHGPFKITQVMSAVNYRLELPTQWSIHPVFHIDLLTPYHETTIHGANYQRPPPDLVEGEEEYEVETVLVSRRFGRGKKLQYLVKWKGYPDSDNQWINKEDVFADDAIREFKNSNPDQETHIRRVNVDSPYPHFPPPLFMQNNTTTPATSTTVSDNWTVRDDSIASTSTASSVPSQSSETTRSQYSFRVEDVGEPISVELQLPTSLEESTTAAESPQSVNSEFPITYYVHGQEAPIPFSLTNEAHIVIGSQENQTPITIPPPGNSPALRHIRVTPSSRDSPEVQTLVHAALNRIRETASATPGGAFFEDDINDIEQVLSLASSLRDPRRGTASEDDATASLMSRLNQVRRPCSPTPVIRRSRTPVTYSIPQNTIPNPASLPTPVFSTSSRRGQLAPESDAPQRRRTRGQRGQGGARVSVVQPVLPVSGHVSRAAESVSDLTTRLTHPPPPLGFERNIGRNYVPCLISLEGRRQVPATYIRVVMSIDPQVIGRREGDEAEYGRPVHAQPDFGAEASRYTPDDLGRFKANAPESEAFDSALMFIHDRALIAEVYRFCQASMAVTQFQRNIEQIQERMWQAGALMEAAARRLEGANSINRIEDAMEELRRRSIHIQQQAREYEEGVTNRRFQCRGHHS
jgi:hypothetical protein